MCYRWLRGWSWWHSACGGRSRIRDKGNRRRRRRRRRRWWWW